jgi:hypothetical protein
MCRVWETLLSPPYTMTMLDARTEIQGYLDRMYPRPPRFRYFQKGRGAMFCWTTERVEGMYGSLVLRPVGAGSRSGKAEEWVCDEDSISSHKLRKDAKARALKLYKESL